MRMPVSGAVVVSQPFATAVLAVALASPEAHPRTLEFAGRTWHVRETGRGAPGPNHWDARNAWVDAQGRLHLRLARDAGGTWRGAEVRLAAPLGFGRYEFKVIGRLDTLDPNVVFGLFNYPPPATGPDGTHEIDIEFTRWGDPAKPPGHWTVHAPEPGVAPAQQAFAFALEGAHSTHRVQWHHDRVRFSMRHGHGDDPHAFEAARWTFAPRDAARRIPQVPLPVHLNLWLFRGQPPRNGEPVELVISDFRFTPAK